MPDAGGMMVATREISQDELEAFAAADPAVQSGLLVYEIRPWLTAMEHYWNNNGENHDTTACPSQLFDQ
jgi:hypothetical protein